MNTETNSRKILELLVIHQQDELNNFKIQLKTLTDELKKYKNQENDINDLKTEIKVLFEKLELYNDRPHITQTIYSSTDNEENCELLNLANKQDKAELKKFTDEFIKINTINNNITDNYVAKCKFSADNDNDMRKSPINNNKQKNYDFHTLFTDDIQTQYQQILINDNDDMYTYF